MLTLSRQILAGNHLGMLKFSLEGNQSTLLDLIEFTCSEKKKQPVIFFNNMDDKFHVELLRPEQGDSERGQSTGNEK